MSGLLELSSTTRVGPLRGARDRPEKDFDLNSVLIAVVKLHNLIESFLVNRLLALLERLVLALNDGPPHGALTLLVTLEAGCERHVENQKSARDLALLGQVEQVFPSLRGECGRINHAEPVRREPQFYQEMN
jgi:hypothetical protein